MTRLKHFSAQFTSNCPVHDLGLKISLVFLSSFPEEQFSGLPVCPTHFIHPIIIPLHRVYAHIELFTNPWGVFKSYFRKPIISIRTIIASKQSTNLSCIPVDLFVYSLRKKLNKLTNSFNRLKVPVQLSFLYTHFRPYVQVPTFRSNQSKIINCLKY